MAVPERAEKEYEELLFLQYKKFTDLLDDIDERPGDCS